MIVAGLLISAFTVLGKRKTAKHVLGWLSEGKLRHGLKVFRVLAMLKDAGKLGL
jgi:hypothetical protein